MRPGTSDEVRALWVRRASLDSEAAIRKMVASATTAGFNTLFVQAIDDGLPLRSPSIPSAETISQAHAAGLRVHAWIDVARVAAPGELPFARNHVVYQHPEWLMVPRAIAAELLAIDTHSPDYLGRLARWTRSNADRIDGLYISPVQPQAAAHLAEIVRDIVRQYAVDGVYFDHVQYPCRRFRLQREVRGRVPRLHARATAARRAAAARRHRGDRSLRISQRAAGGLAALSPVAAHRAHRAAAEHRQSGAPGGDRERGRHVGRDRRGTRQSAGLADVARERFPRCALSDGVGRRRHAGGRAARAGARASLSARPVWAGIGANRLSQRETLDGIGVARRAGAQGIILFSLRQPDQPAEGTDYLSAIGRGAFDGS